MIAKRVWAVLAILFVVPLMVAGPADAKRPLRGEMDLYFNEGFFTGETGCPVVTWAGSIDIDGVTYGMAFFPTGARQTGAAFHFEEIWTVYENPFGFTGGELGACPDGPVVMTGVDSGVTSPNETYRMNGVVEESHGDLAAWQGRRVHMSGSIVYDQDTGFPLTAPGDFRLN